MRRSGSFSPKPHFDFDLVFSALVGSGIRAAFAAEKWEQAARKKISLRRGAVAAVRFGFGDDSFTTFKEVPKWQRK